MPGRIDDLSPWGIEPSLRLWMTSLARRNFSIWSKSANGACRILMKAKSRRNGPISIWPKSVVLVEDEYGQIVASMTLINGDGVTWDAFGYVHPEHQRQGLGQWIIDWSEAIAGDREDETREGYRVEILNFTSTINAAAQKLLAAKGYDVAKVFRRMRIELAERPAPVSWPEGYELRPFVEGRDDQHYFDALQTAFAEHWSFAPRTFENWRTFLVQG